MASGFWFGGKLGQNFIHEFLSSPVLQWPRQNFGSGGKEFSKNVLIKDLKNFEKFIKQFAQKFKNLPNFSKIKFNRIKEN